MSRRLLCFVDDGLHFFMFDCHPLVCIRHGSRLMKVLMHNLTLHSIKNFDITLSQWRGRQTRRELHVRKGCIKVPRTFVVQTQHHIIHNPLVMLARESIDAMIHTSANL